MALCIDSNYYDMYEYACILGNSDLRPSRACCEAGIYHFFYEVSPHRPNASITSISV
jgi:hypothetical protein